MTVKAMVLDQWRCHRQLHFWLVVEQIYQVTSNHAPAHTLVANSLTQKCFEQLTLAGATGA